jgi:hypothetical protein
LLGEREELSQRTDDNDIAMTTFLAWMDFNVAYERTDNVDGLRACRFVIQDLLQLDDLPTVEVGEIGMKLDCPDRLILQLGDELTFARLQFA